jgi:tetratricopeptide (TPR) repeat protein
MPASGVWTPGAAGLALLLVVLVAAAFAPVLQNGFVYWDDPENFLENPYYRGLGWPQLRWAWTSFRIGVYQPLAWMILELQYVLFGLEPRGYHLTSLVFHAVNAAVLFLLTVTLLDMCRSGPKRPDLGPLIRGAGLAVALFAVHPLRVEVVAWASCQPYLPCALFYMLAVLAYLRAFAQGPSPRQGLWLAGTLVLGAAALLSKAVAVSLPAVLLILDVYPLRRLGGGPGRWLGPGVRRVWWEKVPPAALGAVFVGLAVAGRVKSQHLATVREWSFAQRIAQACYGVWFYPIKTLLPWDLTAYYPVPERVGLLEPVFLASLVGTAGLSLGLFLLRRRWPGLLAAWLSYLVILMPNAGLVRLGDQIAADRYSYVAMIGGVVVLAAALGRLWRASRPVSPAGVALAAAGLAVLAGLVVLTRAQCRTWQTSEGLWAHALAHGAGRSYVAHNNLGLALFHQGRLDEALAEFTEALRLKPDFDLVHNNLGDLLSRQGRPEEALARYAEAVRINPGSVELRNNLGMALFRQGRIDEAIAQYAEALRIHPGNAEVHNNLGAALNARGRVDEAIAQYSEVLRLDPGHADAHNNLGVALLRTGRVAEALTQFAEAVRSNPDHADAHSNLGVVLLGQGRLEPARAELEAAIRLNPGLAQAHNNLGMVLFRQGRFAEALDQYAAALERNPGYARAHQNLARLRATAADARHRDGRRAVEAATRACELTGGNDPGMLDTLAAAWAEAGDFAQAVHWQARALDRAGDGAARDAFRSRLKLYQDGQPYREPIETQK